MRPILVVLLLLGALLAPALPAAAQDGQKNPTAEEASQRGSGRPSDPGKPDETQGAQEEDETEGEGRPDDAGKPEDAGDNGRGRGRDEEPRSPTPVPIGRFDVDADAGQAQGEYLSLHYDAAGVEATMPDGTRLFSLAPSGGGAQAVPDVEVKGARMEVESKAFRLVVHDNPSAVSRIRADEPVTLDFPLDARIVARDGERHYAFTMGNLTGKIRGDNIVVNGSRLVAEGDFMLLLDGEESNREDINEAIGRGHVGAEGRFNKADDDVEQDIVSYGNVTMTTVKAERGNLTVLVEGHGFEGRVLVLNVDGRIVGASSEEQLDVLFDNETITRADDLADALDPDNDGLQPEYYVVFDPVTESFQLVVSVPHYSVHTLSVTTLAILPPPSVVFGVVAGVALLVPAAFALFGTRKRR